MCCTQAKLALPAGGAPYFQRASSRRRSPPQSRDVERRVGQDEVGPQVGVQVLVEGVAVRDRSASMPRMARFILRQPPGGVVRLLAVDRDVA